jgi:hypothetical protein
VSGAETPQLALPRAGVHQVGDHDDETAAPGDQPHAAQRVGERDRALTRPGQALETPQQGEHGGAPAPWRADRRARRPEEEGADPVAVARRQQSEGGGRRQREVALLARRGSEVERRGRVDHEPALELAVGHRRAHVGRAGASGEVPVHAAHVVARLVRAAVGWLASTARHQSLVVALQQTVELAGHEQLELGQPPAPADDRGHDASATGRNTGPSWPGVTRGAITARTIVSTTSSAATPSASAS